MSKLCYSHEKLIEKKKSNETYSFFDITMENVRKIYREFVKDQLEKYMPEWENRINDNKFEDCE